MKVDISKWQGFEIGSLFDYENTGNVIVKSVEDDPNGVNFVTAAGKNNGVLGRITLKPEYKVIKGNCIFVGGKTFTVNYQDEDFVSNDSHNFILRYKDGNLSKYQYLFLVSVLQKLGEERYKWNDAVTGDKLSAETIYLPVDEKGCPDWNFMGQYMQSIENIANEEIDDLSETGGKQDTIDICDWKEFQIGELFDIKAPAPRSQLEYNDGEVPFVSSGDYNNGVVKYLQPKDDEILEKGNCITVSPVDGSAFYQEKDFLGRGGAGSSIILLYNEHLNLYNGYYIATILRKVCSKYLFQDMGSKSNIALEKIKLPVKSNGEPDWEYMEEYARKVEISANEELNKLMSVV